MAEIGNPLRRITVIPLTEPIQAPEGPRRESVPDSQPQHGEPLTIPPSPSRQPVPV